MHHTGETRHVSQCRVDRFSADAVSDCDGAMPELYVLIRTEGTSPRAAHFES
jgi:hypothetical protein